MWISQCRFQSFSVLFGAIMVAALLLVLHAQSVVLEEEGDGFEDFETFESIGIAS